VNYSIVFISQLLFFLIFVTKNLDDPDPDSVRNLDLDPESLIAGSGAGFSE
jgi:hypothetical protein